MTVRLKTLEVGARFRDDLGKRYEVEAEVDVRGLIRVRSLDEMGRLAVFTAEALVTPELIEPRALPLAFWRYHIRRGEWGLVQDGAETFPFDGVLIRAGNGPFMNQPEACAVKNHGPLPCGWYDIGAPVDHPQTFGHYGLPLTPWPENVMFGRSGFFFHGAKATDPMNSSDGCPFTPPGALHIRERVADSGINVLQVVAE